jgi:phenylalanyl-tRNA synthetase beta chain
MNVSYRWLKAMVPGLDLTPDALAEHLALRGAPVEEMVSPGAGLGDVVVGRVVTAAQHPNADRLSLCTVDDGSGVVQVVCGAPNVKAGSWYPFVPVGAVLPGDFKLKKSKIRGEFSEGMLCSAKELGLGADHAGILEIHGDFTPGESFVKAMGLDDVTCEVETTSNRGDLLSHIGIARELAAEGSGEVVLPEIPGGPALGLDYVQDAREARAGAVTIRIEAPELCTRYLGAVLRGVKIGPSPAWLQERLRGAGARPINNVVDATNYVLLELGQPLHAFDLTRLADATVVVRRATPDERKFTTLDDEERVLTPDMLMICDARRPVAVAGVMGGQESEVTPDTVDVLLECALFDPKSIRATRRALNMSTDASYRFERGVDPEGLRLALERGRSGPGRLSPGLRGGGGPAARRPHRARAGRGHSRGHGARLPGAPGAPRGAGGGGHAVREGARLPELRHHPGDRPHRGGGPDPRVRRLPPGIGCVPPGDGPRPPHVPAGGRAQGPPGGTGLLRGADAGLRAGG